jgi:hypothetical protein
LTAKEKPGVNAPGFFVYSNIPIVMTTSSLKKELHKTIDEINDNSLLEAVYTLLKKNVRKPLEPMTEKEFYARNSKAQKDIKRGNVVSHKDVKKRFSAAK